MATDDSPAAKKQLLDAMNTATAEREYIVFGEAPLIDSQVAGWQEVGRATAANADTARDKVIDALPIDEQGGPFVTIAARYWQPETFVVETTTVRKARR